MDLLNLSDEQLDLNTLALARDEREILTKVLHHLREIERRKLYASLKYPSLFEYAVTRLGYSYDQAWRRIEAMRLLREVPEVEEKISSGALTLTNVGFVRAILKAKEKENDVSREEKLALVSAFDNLSKREAEKIAVRELGVEAVRVEKTRLVADDLVEVKFTLKEKTLEKVNRLKGLLAHSDPNMGLAELFDKLCDLALAKLDRGVKLKSDVSHVADHVDASTIAQPTTSTPKLVPSQLKANNDRYMTESLKRAVWARDDSKCVNCKSTFALEIDHIIPYAKGGRTVLANLRLLCRNCNQRMAIKHFGVRKIEKYRSVGKS